MICEPYTEWELEQIGQPSSDLRKFRWLSKNHIQLIKTNEGMTLVELTSSAKLIKYFLS